MITRNTFTKTFHHDTYPALNENLPEHSCKGKSVFITGAGTGIGQACAVSFAKASARAIFLAGRTKSTLEETKALVAKTSPDAIVEFFVIDISDSDGLPRAFAAAREKAGALDILVNNAGFIHSVEKTSEVDFDSLWKHFEINVKGSMLVIRGFLGVAAEKGATVVNISSGAAVINFVPGLSAYGASKLATMKLVDYMHREEAHRDLRVFNVQPGVVPTAMAKEGRSNAIDTAELAGAFTVWLASPKADFLKGRFVYANWDVEELELKKEEIIDNNLLTLTLRGWDSSEFDA